jgi:hypothetical protein
MIDPNALALLIQWLPTAGVSVLVVLGLVAWQALK